MFGFRDIEIVREIVRAGGFRAAAQRSGLAQSAISTRIASLEKRLGIKLFDRVGRSVRLSAAGRRFLEEADRLIDNRNRVVQELTQTNGLSGIVRIGVAETIVHTILTALLGRLHLDHAAVRFELSVDTSEHLSDKLVADEIDIAILLSQFQPPGSVSTPLKPVKLDWFFGPEITAPAEPWTLAQLSKFPIVTFPKKTPPHRQVEQLFLRPEFSPPILHGSASLSTVLHLVGDGFGIGVLPSRMVEAMPLGRNGQVRPLPVEPAAVIDDLEFVVAYFSRRNQTEGEIITQTALDVDQNDLI